MPLCTPTSQLRGLRFSPKHFSELPLHINLCHHYRPSQPELSLKTVALLTAVKTVFFTSLLRLSGHPSPCPQASQPPRTSFSVLSAQFFLAPGLSGSLVGPLPSPTTHVLLQVSSVLGAIADLTAVPIYSPRGLTANL